MFPAAKLLHHAAHVPKCLKRVLEHIPMMVLVLTHSLEPVDLGENDGQRTPAGQIAQRGGAVLEGEQQRQFLAQPLAADPRQAGSGAGRSGERRRLRRQAMPTSQARQAQDAQRIVVQGVRRAQAQAVGAQVVAAAERVDQGAAGERPRHRIDGEVPRQEVAGETLVGSAAWTCIRDGPQRRHVHVQFADDDTPGAERV